MSKFKGKYRIESTRLQNWNYGWDGVYFVTIVTKNRQCFFGEISKTKQMILSEIGKIAEQSWIEIPSHFPFVELDEFVVMPNHIHGIIIINKKGFIRKINDEIDLAKSQTTDWNYNDFLDLESDPIDCRDKACLVSTADNSNQNDQNKSEGQKRFRNPGKNNLSSIIGSYKSAVSNKAHLIDMLFDWQNLFDDRLIRDEKGLNKVRGYIRNNPKNWHSDNFQ